ncbi:MAG: hypothetical protein ACRD3J_21205, partial [Thermoanaerobaculia bacterium]
RYFASGIYKQRDQPPANHAGSTRDKDLHQLLFPIAAEYRWYSQFEAPQCMCHRVPKSSGT